MKFMGVSLILWMLLGNGFEKIILHNYACADNGLDKERSYALVKARQRRTITTTEIMFTAFKSLEQIDADATLSDISAFAQKRFGDHPFVDEWIKLCFQLIQNKKGSPAELRRFAELQSALICFECLD